MCSRKNMQSHIFLISNARAQNTSYHKIIAKTSKYNVRHQFTYVHVQLHPFLINVPCLMLSLYH